MPLEVAAVNVWQVLGSGEGFMRAGKVERFALSGFVRARSPNEAASQAIAIAKHQFAGLDQLQDTARRWPLINWEEIQDASALALAPDLLDKLELHWASDEA